MDALYIAMEQAGVQVQQAQHRHEQSIGIIHQKMQDRYRVALKLPEKTDSFDNMFRYADAYGKIRLGYYGARFKEQTARYRNNFGSAVGGIFGMKTASFHGFNLDAAVYVSQDLPFLYDTQKRSFDFLTTGGDSYAYLAEASVNYASNLFEIKIGRFAVDMPYANTDDLRMSRNSFEGAWGIVHYDETLSSQFFFIQRWAGFDSQDEDGGLNQNEFKELVDGGRGMIGASLAYRYNDESEVSLWYHDIDKMASIIYTEVNGVEHFSKIHLDYGAQYAHIMEQDDSNVDGDVTGAMMIVHYENFFAGAAANFARVEANDYVTDGFGGGPYFTSLDEVTIAFASETSPGKDIDMYRYSLGIDIDRYDSSLEYAYGIMRTSDNELEEHDLIYTLDIDEKWQSQIIIADFKMETSDNRLSRVVARIDYNF